MPRDMGRRERPSPLWLIEPAAAAQDPRWQGRAIWRLAVAAPTAAFARVAAERWASQPGSVPVGNVSPMDNAGFEDTKLYRVRSLAPGSGPPPAGFAGSDVVVLAGPEPSLARA